MGWLPGAILAARSASAQPVAATTEPAPAPSAADVELVPPPRTADDVRAAPRPGQESGRLDPLEPADGPGRKLGRGLLMIPRVPFEMVAQPVRGLLYLEDTYAVTSKVRSIFTSEDGRLGIYPTAMYETGFGLNIGVRGYFEDIFGQDERVSIRAATGGSRHVASIDFDSGTRLARWLRAGVLIRYDDRTQENFYGYGNAREADVAPPVRIDPVVDDTAVHTRYRVQTMRAAPRLRFQLPRDVALTASGAIVTKDPELADPETTRDLPIQRVYAVETIPGFLDGTTFLYGELELAWDTRRGVDPFDVKGVQSAGGLALVYGGRQAGLNGPDFFRVGFDLQRYVRLTAGPRALRFRLWGEGITGDIDEVPFTELPRLGGQELLRGYFRDRFRDRVAAVAQASYLWSLGRAVAATVFVDAGRVYGGLGDLTLDDLRVGFGGALEVYHRAGLILRAELASSIDGGLFAYIGVDPAFQPQSRARRF